MKHILIFIAVIFLFISSCSKENRKGCWQAFDAFALIDVNGNVVCDKTKAEAEAQYPNFMFYRQGAAKYCWKIIAGSNTYYSPGIPEEIAAEFNQNGVWQLSKVNCSSFCNVEWKEMHKSKRTGLYNPSRSIGETFLKNPDTCSKLFVNRVVTYRETTDSLITREVLSKEP
ncbi:MAG: hypothetical protein SGI83_03515 [Bacteroidota bacterium]|nr:hypothetical protein [Bacteroidota bacterium]